MGALTVREGPFEGFYLIDLQIHEDAERQGASFREVFQAEKLGELGLPAFQPKQMSVAESPRGTLRGIHAEPWEKYVHVVHGRAYNVVVDLRNDSATFGTWWAGELDRTTAIFLSRGLGNGYQALTDDVLYSYLVSEHWRSDVAYPAVAWDDPDLAIPWPITDARLQLSSKDRGHPPLSELRS